MENLTQIVGWEIRDMVLVGQELHIGNELRRIFCREIGQLRNDKKNMEFMFNSFSRDHLQVDLVGNVDDPIDKGIVDVEREGKIKGNTQLQLVTWVRLIGFMQE